MSFKKSGCIAFLHGVVAATMLSTVLTLMVVMLASFHNNFVWRLGLFLAVMGMGFAHWGVLLLHRGRLFYPLDTFGILLVPLATPWTFVAALRFAFLRFFGEPLSHPTDWLLLIAGTLVVIAIGIPSVWRIFWLYMETPNKANSGVFQKPGEPRFRSNDRSN